MGTTLTTLLFHGGYVHLGHVGDSRAYLYRDGRARQLSEDHSWIQEQVRAGLISPEEAKESRFRNIITRSVGFEPSVEPDLQGLSVQAGDCFVLCSDGLSNYLTVEELAQVLTGHCYRDVPTVFIDLANERGGDDNVTCLAIYAGNEERMSRAGVAHRRSRPRAREAGRRRGVSRGVDRQRAGQPPRARRRPLRRRAVDRRTRRASCWSRSTAPPDAPAAHKATAHYAALARRGRRLDGGAAHERALRQRRARGRGW